MELKLINDKGQSSATVSASDALFAREYNEALIHQLVVAYQANARQATAKTKKRHDVNGSGIKNLTVKKPVNMAELKTMVSMLGEALAVPSQSDVINAELEEKYQTLQKAIAARGEKKALFIMNEMGQGKNGSSQNFAGNDTSANALIELLGMSNPFAKQFSAYKAVNVET